MKPSSPASLLLFLSLSAALPIPFAPPKDCNHYTTCESWLRETFTPSENDHTPPTHLQASPHFPEHQLYPPSSLAEAHRKIEEEDFNNSPLIPPNHQPPTVALSAERPLQSSYLLLLSNPEPDTPRNEQADQSTDSADNLPAKPTSALPRLREEDTLRYWATISKPPSHPSVSEESTKSDGIAKTTILRFGRPIVLVREHNDLLVVGIVVVFLAIVVIMEAMEYVGDLRSAICCRERRGDIFLPHDELATCRDRKSISIQPTRYKTNLPPLDKELEKGECHD